MKVSRPVYLSLQKRLFAWFSIVTQIVFPLSVAFTPAVAGNDGRFLQNQSQNLLQTQVYTLGEGESVSSVAVKYRMTPDALRKLNQFRTFARGFEHLRPGDELDVPVSPLSEVQWDNADALSAPADLDTDAQAQKAAGYVSQAGNFLASGANGDTATSMARGMATGAAGGQIQQWLSRFGTARVQLDADKNFSLKNSQLDLLVPLHEQKDSLVFSQGSIHRTDERTQSNLGFGYRWLAGDWMLGANTFLDYDLSRDHARAGAGLEFWRDFLKLGFNGYTRLTGWQDSPHLVDYQERPANGWDVRAQYWLPSLPQLGGKLTYEQYYGKEVALFGVDNRQHDPHAITAGINYTPVPLLTFSAEQRQGGGSNAGTRFGVEINYQLGMPWQHQINPDAVAAMRSLAGSRYDLVERNNNIVLEYRKKEVIRLKTADLVIGHPGEQKSLGVSVSSKYGLERIDWSAPPLIAAGGKFVQNGGEFAVVMPEYRADVKNYTVTGVAVDKKGNLSNQAEIQVTVQAPQVSSIQSTFTPGSSMLPADGKSTQVLTLSVKDANGQPVNTAVSDVEMRSENQADATLSSLESKGDGVMVVTVTAGVLPAVLSLTPVVQGVSLPAAKVVISDSTPDAGRSSFSVSPDIIPADNATTSLLTVSLMNEEGLPVAGVKGSLALTLTPENGRARSSAPVTLSDITEEQAGRYTATLKGSRAGVYTATPQYNGAPLGSLSATVTLEAGNAVLANSAITRDRDSYVSGSDITLRVTLKDGSSTPNPVAGLDSAALNAMVAVGNAGAKSDANWTETTAGSGIYTGLFVAQAAGTGLKATLTLAGGSKDSATYSITADDAVLANSAITRDRDSYVSGSDITLTVTLKDGSSTPNPVAGLDSAALNAMVAVGNAGAKSDANWTETTAGSGIYTGLFVAQAAGTGLKATLTLSGGGSKDSTTYSITAGEAVQVNSSIEPDNTDYVIGDDMIITVTLKDNNGYAVTGQAASLTPATVTIPHAVMKAGSSWVDADNGTYIATYVATEVAYDTKGFFKLPGWQYAAIMTKSYKISAGSPIQANSGIETDNSAYVADADIVVTVTLKDKNGQAVTGESAALTPEAVSVPNATLKSSGWQDNGNGTYTATYTAKTGGEGLKATLKLADWGEESTSRDFVIYGTAILKGIYTSTAIDYTFNKDAGFPTTGFNGAWFRLLLSSDNGGKASDYNWSSNAPSWVSVSNGVVSFKGTGTGDKVTIIGTPKSGVGNSITYSFKLQSWFIPNSSRLNPSEASLYCQDAGSGYDLPTIQQLGGAPRGTIGGLYGEWGQTKSYAEWPTDVTSGWTTERDDNGERYRVKLNFGDVYTLPETNKAPVVCRKAL